MRIAPASVIAATIALAGTALATTAGAASPAPRHAAPALVRLGEAPLLPRGAVRLGPLATSTELQLEVALKPRDPAALARFATAVSTPGSPLYHHYLKGNEFTTRFGPTPAAVTAVETALRGAGLRPGAISKDHLLIPVTASAGKLAIALATGFERVRVGKRIAYADTVAPRLPATAARYLTAIVGLDTLDPPQPLSLTVGHPHSRPRVSPPRMAETSGPQPCQLAQEISVSDSSFTADQLAAMYDFSPLYATGDLGSEGGTPVKVGIFELEANIPADIAAFQSCYGTSASVTYQKVGNGPGRFQSGTDEGLETELDIEQVIGLAPDVSITVYQGTNTNDDSGPLATYEAMIGSGSSYPQVISTSWGECESVLQAGGPGQSAAASENTLFEEAASYGQSVFAAAGDNGSEDCYESNESEALAVDDPASQPYVTGAGGTTTTAIGPPPTQTVWNSDDGGTGGGISSIWTMPTYQTSAPSSLHVINGNSSGTPCAATAGEHCREVPDVAADADPNDGITIYYDEEWTSVGGTSAAAPAWAAVAAILDADSECSSDLGFANGALYQAAADSYSTTFDDVTNGNNDVGDENGGRFPAGVGYDMATGLGTPDVAGLAAAICGPAVAPAAPSHVTAAAGRTATPGNGEVDLSWTAPSDGGAAIEHYTVTPSPACSACGGLTATGTSTIVSELVPGRRYTFSVTATNTVGTGPQGTSSSIIVYTKPSPPRSVHAAADGAGAVKVTFVGPVINGGEAIKDYQVLTTPVCAHCGGTIVKTGTAKVTGLEAGTTYRFYVRATNAAGTGGVSAASNPVKVT